MNFERLHQINLKLRALYYFPIQPSFIKALGPLIFGYSKNSQQVPMNNINKILIIKLDEIGDTILVSPFIRELRKNFPAAVITIIVKPKNYGLLEFCPYVDRVLTFDVKFNKLFRVFQQYLRIYALGKNHLWKEKYELCIIPRWDGDDLLSVPLAYLSGSKNVLGYDQQNGSESLLTIRLKKNKVQHEVLQSLDIISYLGGKTTDTRLEFWPGKEDINYAQSIIGKTKKNKDMKSIAIAPGALWPTRRWDIKSYAALVNKIVNECNDKFLFVLLGSKEEISLANYIITNNAIADILSQMGITLRQTAALVEQCELFIGNNSGLAHIAASVGTPGITIFSHPQSGNASFHNSPERFKPWYSKNVILQPQKAIHPCSDGCISKSAHCINQITVDEVFAAYKKLI